MRLTRGRGSSVLLLALPLTAAVVVLGMPACAICTARAVGVRLEGPGTMYVGEIVQLAAIEFFTGSAPSNPVQPSSHAITWASSNGGVLSVSADGRVHAHAPGTATISATPLVVCIGAVNRAPAMLTIVVVP